MDKIVFKVWQENPKYEVGNDGKVYSVKYHGSNIKKPLRMYLNPSGYRIVNLFSNGKRKSRLVHRMLAISFIPNPENKCCINHINGNRADNTLTNLEWVTHSENIIHGFRVLGRKHSAKQLLSLRDNARGDKNPNIKLTPEDVKTIRAARTSLRRGEIVETAKHIATKYGISHHYILALWYKPERWNYI